MPWHRRQQQPLPASQSAHRDGVGQRRFLAADGRRPAKTQRRRQAGAGHGAGVELGHEVLHVEHVVEDAGVEGGLSRRLRHKHVREFRGIRDATTAAERVRGVRCHNAALPVELRHLRRCRIAATGKRLSNCSTEPQPTKAWP